MGPSQSPKLEDFMGTHQMESNNNERDAMSLSHGNTNNPYFNQNPRDAYIDHMAMTQNLNYFQSPVPEGVVYHPPLDWTCYNEIEQGVAYRDHIESLDLSMSNGSRLSDCVPTPSQELETPSVAVTATDQGLVKLETSKKRGGSKSGTHKQSVHRKSIDTFGQRTSQYRGVTRFVKCEP